MTNLTFQACVQLGTGVHIDKCVSLAADTEGSSYLLKVFFLNPGLRMTLVENMFAVSTS